MAVKIERAYFISPREAFQIVGAESFRSSWDPSCAEDEDSEQRHVALNNLRAALESGRVQAYWHDFDYERPLRPYEAAGEFFQINLKKDCIHLSFFAGKPIQCGISREDLLAFIRSASADSSKFIIGAERACERWLVSRFRSDDKIPKSDVLLDQVRTNFPRLSKAGYLRARKRAIELADRPDLKAPGRRKSREI
ncbi:hypothetical protein N8071_00455 [bacterium]|nr:hypothetical protein [bacterium]